MSTNPRSADASIAGYLYQFDKSILEILNASDDATVLLEGHEDVDLRGPDAIVAIQCKYHEKGAFSLKKIRAPVLAMLESFAAGHEIQYRLYGHYGQQVDEIPDRLTLSALKDSLTKKGRDGTIRYYDKFNEQTLVRFTDHLEIIVGPSLSAQRESVLAGLRAALGGSDADAAELHYPNAISMVLDISAVADEAARIVRRAAFLESLDKRQVLFTRWHREFLGATQYLKTIEKRIKSLGLVNPTRRRMVILGAEELASATSSTRPVDLVKQIAEVKFGIGFLSNARPWTVVVEADRQALADIKAGLVCAALPFEDGFEDVGFSPDLFDRPVVINTGAQDKKISAISYGLRLVGLQTLYEHASSLAAPDVLLSFRGEPADVSWTGQGPRELNVAGCHLDQLAELVGRLA